MPYSDPQQARAWRAAYTRPAPLPVIGRYRVLEEDIAQQRALAELEGRRIGHARAGRRLADWLRGERAWIGVTVGALHVED